MKYIEVHNIDGLYVILNVTERTGERIYKRVGQGVDRFDVVREAKAMAVASGVRLYVLD